MAKKPLGLAVKYTKPLIGQYRAAGRNENVSALGPLQGFSPTLDSTYLQHDDSFP